MKYPILLSLVLFAWGCGGDATTPTTNPSDSTTVLTVAPRCFQLETEGMDEYWALQIQDGKVKGTGNRVFHRVSERFEIKVDGSVDAAGQIKVNLTVTKVQDNNFAETHYETWFIQGQTLKVINRNLAEFKGDFVGNEINCVGSEKKDSSLFDQLDGYYNGYAIAKRNGNYAIVNDKKEVTTEMAPDYILMGIVSDESVVFLDKKINKQGVIDVNGTILIEPKYDKIRPFNEGLAAFVSDEGFWGFLDKKGTVVVKPQFNQMAITDDLPNQHPFNEGLAAVGRDGKWGYINTKGKMVIPMKFGHGNPFKNGEAQVYSETGKWIWIDKTGKCIRDCE